METTQSKRRASGGAATGGGMNFQAAVTAITYIHMARGCPLLWLDSIVDDVPIAIEAETGGAGDDLRLLLKDTRLVEIQVKKGLRSGTELWDALTKLAKAVTTEAASFGVLVVSPSSSNTITNDLAKDIIRVGDGRTDNLSTIASQFLEKLNLLSIPARDACAHIRIQTVSATNLHQEAIRTAHAYLTHICADNAQIGAAWDALYADASRLIELQGRRDVSSLQCVLMSSGITLSQLNEAAPTLLLAKLTRWTLETHKTFSIFGIGTPLNTDEAWIPLTAIVREQQNTESKSLAEELHCYQEWENRSKARDAQSIDPETLGRFVNRAVVVAGPGMGKTTLLKRIARRYSENAIPVLCVRLSMVAARMQRGASFEESVFHLGLDGSGISVGDAQQVKLANWLLLCDGLDECGSLQEEVAAGAARFALGHPDCRILVTTRPVGYRATHFTDWRHYDLPALDTSRAHSHATRLVEAIAPPGSDLIRNAWKVCRRELHDTSAAKIVGRTPLLLGLAAAIIARGKTLGTTRERLFEQIFELIDDVPNARIPEKPAATTVLRCFLDILGWEMTSHPLSSVNETIKRCADHLMREAGAGPLTAAGDAERYLNYWQDVGMIERVGNGDQQTLAFIHKSFGEFVASRRLCVLHRDAQTAIVAEIGKVPAWGEVLRFAGMMGLADQIADHLLTDFSMDADTVKRIRMAIELIAEAVPPPDSARRSQILEIAFRVAASDRRYHAFDLAQPLVAVARRFPAEVSPAASVLINSERPWTRLIAWGCLVAAGLEHYSLDSLIDALPRCADDAGPGSRSSLGGGIMLSDTDGRELAETFILNACAAIIDHSPPQIADIVVPEVLNHPNFGNHGFVTKAHSLLLEKGKTYRIGSMDWPNPVLSEEERREYYKQESLMYEAIFDALDLPELASHEESPPPRLLHLSAFIEASKMDKVPAYDARAWSRPFDRAATRATLQAFIAVSGIDLKMLKQDAVHAKRLLDRGEGSRDPLFDLIVHVDPPLVDWARAKEMDIDTALIEQAVSHPSEWIMWLAGSILEHALEPNELECAVRRLLETGRGLALWVACGLASELDQQRALSLVLERLGKPLVRGCGYLFDLLCEGVRPQTDQLISPITVGLLNGDVKTAVATAKLAAEVAEPGLNGLVPILKKAYAHWQVHEEPSPTESGRVPDSPRANLIEALVKIQPPSYNDIKIFLQDSHHDVRGIGAKVLVQRLQELDGERQQFFMELEAGDLPAHLLGAALKANLPLSEEEVATVERLLTSQSKHIRYGAMALFSEHYLRPDQIHAHANVMVNDSEQQIKDRAFSILDIV